MMSEVIEFPGWRRKLGRNESTGTIYPTSGNIMLFLQHDTSLRGLLAFDELAGRPVITRPPPAVDGEHSRPGPYPRAWQSEDAELVLAYLQVECQRFSREGVKAAMRAAASGNRFHPVRDWLATLTWDGRERVGKWLQQTFGAPDTPYIRAIGRAFLIAAVRRVRCPGYKFDYMIVLEGAQGIGKSTAVAVLFGAPWFTDRLPRDIDSSDAIRAMQGKWCAELAEGIQIMASDVERIKAFLSRHVDRIIPKYENDAIDIPRQCVCIATTNRDDYLRDTENRRFWPVKCTTASIDWLTISRDQIWAEAAALEAEGGDVWLRDPAIRAAAEAEQAERVADDTWIDVLRDWLALRPDVTMAEVLSDALGIPRERHERKYQWRAGDCLRRIGYEKYAVGRGGSYGGKRWRRSAKVEEVESGGSPGGME